MPRPALLLVCLSLAACAEPGPAPGPGSAAATLDNGRLREAVRLGGLDGPVETTFGNVQAIRPIPGGGFHIVDGQVPVIRRYSADGTYLGDLGRGGEGTGRVPVHRGARHPERRPHRGHGRLEHARHGLRCRR